jgi:long-chain acyl-CoA synthetase
MGAIWAPFNPEWRAREITRYASRVNPRVLVTRSDLLPLWRDSECPPPKVILIDDADMSKSLLESNDLLPPLPQPADAPCLFLPTSGSTDRPRIVMRTVRNLLAAAQSSAEVLGLRPGMREICVMPFHHSGGFSTCLLLPLLTGMTSILRASFNPADFAGAVADEKVQVLMGSPFVYTMLLESRTPRDAFDSVEIALSSGAPIAPRIVQRCADELGLVVRQHYGAAETGVIAIQAKATPFVSGLVGHPVPSALVKIVDEHGVQLPLGRTGTVAVCGPSVITCYHDQDVTDSALFHEGWFYTGDLGYIDPSGVLLLAGRSKLMINVSGLKIDPVEIEHVVKELPAVLDCMVRGVRDDKETEIVEALIVLREGHALTRQAFIAHCRERLSEYKLPRRVTFCESLPVEITGKRRKTFDKTREKMF